MKTIPALATLALLGVLMVGCQSTTQTASSSTAAGQRAQREQLDQMELAQKRQTLLDLVRLLEIQLDGADAEVGRLQSLAAQGGSFQQAYNEAYEIREEIRARLEDARTQLATIEP